MEHVFVSKPNKGTTKANPFGCPVIFKHWLYQGHIICVIIPLFHHLPKPFDSSVGKLRDVKDVFLGLDSTGEGTISLSDARLLKKDVV